MHPTVLSFFSDRLRTGQKASCRTKTQHNLKYTSNRSRAHSKGLGLRHVIISDFYRNTCFPLSHVWTAQVPGEGERRERERGGLQPLNFTSHCLSSLSALCHSHFRFDSKFSECCYQMLNLEILQCLPSISHCSFEHILLGRHWTIAKMRQRVSFSLTRPLTLLLLLCKCFSLSLSSSFCLLALLNFFFLVISLKLSAGFWFNCLMFHYYLYKFLKVSYFLLLLLCQSALVFGTCHFENFTASIYQAIGIPFSFLFVFFHLHYEHF